MGRKPTEKAADKRQLGVRLSEAGWERLDDLCDYYGRSQQGTIELLLEKQVASLDPFDVGDAYDLCRRLYEYLTRRPQDRRRRRIPPLTSAGAGTFLASVRERTRGELADPPEPRSEPRHTSQ